MKNIKFAIAVTALLALLLTAGCAQGTNGKGDATDNSSVSSSAVQSSDAAQKKDSDKKSAAAEIRIKVYYPDTDGTKLIAVTRKVKTDASTDKYTAAMKSLLSGTQEKGQITILPKTVQLRSVTVKNGIAKVDFSQDLIKKFNGGSTGESLLVGSVVDTLTEFPEVKQVEFLVEGKPIESIAGHVDTTAPIKRMENLIK